MWRLTLTVAAMLGVGLCACQQHPWKQLPDAPAEQAAAVRELWQQYLQSLLAPQAMQEPLRLSRFFADGLLAATQPDTFVEKVRRARQRASAGAFTRVSVESVKVLEPGLLLVLDTPAGPAGVPVAWQEQQPRLASLDAATGSWLGEPRFAPAEVGERPSLLYMQRYLLDDKAPVRMRLRAAVTLARPEFREQIIEFQRREANLQVRLALGLARVRIDGWDESFLRGFPRDTKGIEELHRLDGEIFEEMLVKLTNMAAMVENPPANEILYQVARHAPPALAPRLGRALYELAEASPARFVNAIHAQASSDLANDPVLGLVSAHLRKQDARLRKLEKFLRKFARIGEAEERALCRRLLAWLAQAGKQP